MSQLSCRRSLLCVLFPRKAITNVKDEATVFSQAACIGDIWILGLNMGLRARQNRVDNRYGSHAIRGRLLMHAGAVDLCL
jgi:hypothetical protein